MGQVAGVVELVKVVMVDKEVVEELMDEEVVEGVMDEEVVEGIG